MYERTCSIEGCERRAEKRGWCSTHYSRWRRWGDAEAGFAPKRVPRLCIVPNCGKIHYIGGYCRSHHRQANRERINAQERERWMRLTPEKHSRMLAKAKRYAVENAERVAARNRAYAEQRRQQLAAKQSAYMRANREKYREYWRRKYARKRNTCVFPIPPSLISAKVAYWGQKCWMCGAPWQEIDHVKPLAKEGPHMLANLRPICRSCNARKNAQWPLPQLRRAE